jgi:hypothetical protein
MRSLASGPGAKPNGSIGESPRVASPTDPGPAAVVVAAEVSDAEVSDADARGETEGPPER